MIHNEYMLLSNVHLKGCYSAVFNNVGLNVISHLQRIATTILGDFSDPIQIGLLLLI